MKKAEKSVILIVDDKPANLLALESVLASKDRMLLNASSGEEALKITLQKDIDLIILDVQMPGMDGFEATRIIRGKEKSSGTRLPIIAMTAHAMKGDEERCLAAGMDGYVSKPIEVEQLLAVIDRVLSATLVVRPEPSDGPVPVLTRS